MTLSRGKGLAKISKRPKKCPVCDRQFVKTRPVQPTCARFDCQIEYAMRKQVAKKVAPYVTKPSRPRKDLSHQLELTQKKFNAWIRWRDRDKPCVSSGRTEAVQWDAGHYRPVGGMGGSILRFDPMNCHKQDSEQNQHQSGALTDYRVTLIERIGLEQVERLENTNGTKKWSVEELKEIRAKYSKLLRDAQRESGEE